MLERVRENSRTETEVAATHSNVDFSIADILFFLRSYWPVIAASALLGLSFGIAYVITAKRIYTATAQILIETDQQQPTGTLLNSESLIAMDTPQIESQIALLQSEQIASKVVEALNQRGGIDVDASASANADQMTDAAAKIPASKDARSTSPTAAGSYFSWIYELFSGRPSQETRDEKQARLHAEMLMIQGGMDVRRVGMSYVLNVSYRADNPKTAARVANAIGDAYVQDKLDIRAQNARRGGVWLESRIEELRRSMNNAALDVQIFKARRDYRLVPRPEGSPRDEDMAFATSPEAKSGAERLQPQLDGGPTEDAKDAAAAPERTTLDELESREETYKKIYESYLQAYMETVQRQSYPGTNARVITRANPPARKSSPRTTLALAASLVVGTMMGVGLSLVHLSLDQSARVPRQIPRKLDMPLLGEITRPHFWGNFKFAHLLPHRLFRRGDRRVNASFFISQNRLYAETARELSATAVALKKAMEAQNTHIVGVVGTSPDLNAAAVSSNLALLNAEVGWQTLLIEVDTASSNLDSQFPESRRGLQDLLQGTVEPGEVISPWMQNPRLHLLLAKGTGVPWEPEQISSIRSIIARVADHYELIVVHLPNVNSSNRAFGAVDSFVIVGRAGKTTMPELIDITASLRLAGKQPLGVVMTDLV